MTNKAQFFVDASPEPDGWLEEALAAGDRIAQTELVLHVLTMMVVFGALNDGLKLGRLEKSVPPDILKIAKNMAKEASLKAVTIGNSESTSEEETMQIEIPTDKPELTWPLFVMRAFFQSQFLDERGRDFETFIALGEAIEKAEGRNLSTDILQKKIDTARALEQFSGCFEMTAKSMALEVAGYAEDVVRFCCSGRWMPRKEMENLWHRCL
jgi:hypothetical protein